MNANEKNRYLERNIEVIKIKELKDIEDKNFKNSVLLLYFGLYSKISLNDINSFIQKIILLEPLNISISGKKNNEVFDLLLEKLSNIQTSHHIMTGKCDGSSIKKILDYFLINSWPDEKNFDNWNKYSILVFGNDLDFNKFQNNLNRYLKK